MIINNRKPEFECNEIFLKRWSPRAMSGEEISDEELMILFEAAKWAPSTYNAQPWRFLYAKRGSEDWEKFLDLLVEPNRVWCKNAAALVVMISKKTFEHNGKPDSTSSLCSGSAWQNLALQATMNGLVTHGMAGFDYERARKALKIPEDYKVEMMIAIGRPGKKEDLPENLQEKEIPSGRKKLKEIVMKGEFKELEV
ncbi:nitroreductase [Candidatus Woesearchaeota archaeon]|nr:MAG: nitroreductase [Candidatus Woesearchaeota archaeon]